MGYFTSSNKKLWTSYTLVIAISILLAIVVWNYYAQKVQRLEEQAQVQAL